MAHHQIISGVYGVTEPDQDAVRIFIDAIQAEWRRLFRAASPGEVQRAKNMLKTLLLAQCDGTTAVCEDIGRQMLTYGRRIPLAEIDARIEAVSPGVLKDVVGTYVYDRDPVVVGLGGFRNLTLLIYLAGAKLSSLRTSVESYVKYSPLPIASFKFPASIFKP